MMTAELANHASLRALAAGVDPSPWPELDEATLGPPIPRPPKIIAMALNYRSHAEEAGKAIPLRAARDGQVPHLHLRPVR